MKAFATLRIPSRVTATVRRMPICSSLCRGRLHPSATSSRDSGTTGISQSHQPKCQIVQPRLRLTIASATCAAIRTTTAGVASQRDSTCSSRSVSSPAVRTTRGA